MKTELDPRPVEPFDDLLAFTEAELKEFREPYERTWWDRALAVLIWILILIAVALVTVAVCFLIWWGQYGDNVTQGLLMLLVIFLEGGSRF